MTRPLFSAIRYETFNKRKSEHEDAGDCLVCDRKRFSTGAVVYAHGLLLPYCVSCIDKLHEAAHSTGLG
jgi:hypothetical protein